MRSHTRLVHVLLLGLSIVLGAVVLPLADTAVAGAAQSHRSPSYYVSLGDSYSVGFQPDRGSTPGYTVYVAKKTHLKLVNFGCGGATTTSILDAVGCPDVLPHTAGGMTYPTMTQIAAASAFLQAHRGHIGLITVSIGGNDATGCATQANPVSCIVAVANNIKTNVTTLAADLRAAAGPKVPIIGSTYPDVVLGAYVYPTNPAAASTLNLAKLSVVAFKSIINPALTKAYATSKGTFVDVTAATGGYIPLTRTVQNATYGTIPVAVDKVCTYSWFCSKGNIHATTTGYALIGKLIVAKYHTHAKR
jgi:lysophospholipase L1-like esterase